MGVLPVVLQILGFLVGGYFIGKSDRRSFFNNILLIAALALALPGIIVIWMGAFNYNGYLFITVEFLQLTLFGMIGIAVGYFKQKWDIHKEKEEY